MRYVPLGGVRILNHEIEPWEPEVVALARRLDPSERDLWITLGKRFERASTSRSTASNRRFSGIASREPAQPGDHFHFRFVS